MDFEDYTLDYYLDQLREEESLQEVDPLVFGGAVSLAVGSVYLIGKLIAFFIASAAYRKAMKIDPNLSKEFTAIIKDGNYWNVHIAKDKAPNAFAITGNHVYITSGLIEMLNKREIYAVLLHEAFHCKDLHVWKGMAAEHSFAYLIIFVAITGSMATGLPFLGAILAFLMKNILHITYSRIFGRRHEIKSDEYAVKYGYGDELISSLVKMEKWGRKMMSKQQCDKWCQLERKVSEAIDEHPPTKKRVEIILRKTKELERAANSGFAALQKFVVGVFKNNG